MFHTEVLIGIISVVSMSQGVSTDVHHPIRDPLHTLNARVLKANKLTGPVVAEAG